MFDKYKHQQRLARAQVQFVPNADFLMAVVVKDLLVRLSAVNRTFGDGIALFGRTPFLADEMTASTQIRNVYRVEELHHIGEADRIATPTLLGLEKESADLIIAPLSLHWSNDLPGTLIQLRQTLRPDGLLLVVLPGPDTLHELRSVLLAAESDCSDGAAVRVDAFTDIRDAGALLQRTQFALPVVDQDLTTVRYDKAQDIIRDLRGFGVTSHLTGSNSPPLTRAMFKRLEELYKERFSDPDGRIRASFSFVSMAAWAPHDSQQKPLKPGSATTRLADTLKVKEVKLKG